MITMVLALVLTCQGLPVEFMSLDFSDAFKQLVVAACERRFFSGKAGSQ